MKLLRLIAAYKYEIIAFLTGASVMVLEIVGARLIAPQFGTSTYVWTAMIGVILGSLAVGYAVGGKLADKYHSSQFLALILFVAAILVLITGTFQETIIENIASFSLDLRLGAFLAAVILFGLPSFLIGMVSPHLAKVRITSLETSGFSVGRLEAAGALGSIVGTFSCGYYLLGAFGSRWIVFGVVVVLLLTSLLAEPFLLRKLRLFSFLLAGLLGLLINSNASEVLADTDSSYTRYRVVQGSYQNRPAHFLMIDNYGIQSAALASGDPELILTYTQESFAAAQAYGNPGRVLIVGGGAYTVPATLVRTYPDIHVDVAEIDPALDELARKYFFLQDSPRLSIHHADGRTYLNNDGQPYDLIYMDAFSSLSPPFQLTTRETVERIEARLLPNGVAVVNLIGRYDGGDGQYLRAMQATYESVFKHVSVHQTDPGLPLNARQNFMLYASNEQPKYQAVTAEAPGPALALRSGGLVLTDDYAPIERLTY